MPTDLEHLTCIGEQAHKSPQRQKLDRAGVGRDLCLVLQTTLAVATSG